MQEQTPHEKVLPAPGMPDHEELRAAALRGFAVERKGQHVWFTAPTFRGLDVVYAFAKDKGLKILHVEVHRQDRRGDVYLVKAVDSP